MALEAQVSAEERGRLSSTLSTSRLLQDMARLQREVDEAEAALGHKLTELHTFAQQQVNKHGEHKRYSRAC